MEMILRHGPPHMTWLVAGLLVQRERQRWHHEVTRQVRELEDDDGSMPGIAGWRYHRHGSGVCLIAPDGEVLDVDHNDQTGAIIDVWFFARRIESLKDSERWFAERRLWRWRPLRDVIVDGCGELVACGAARYSTGYENHIVLAPELDACARVVSDELALPGAAERWLAALEPGGEAAHIATHRAWIGERLQSSSRAGKYLDLALRDATSEEAVALCRPFLARPDWAAGRAIELLRGRPDTPLVPEVAKLVRRASLTSDHPFAPYQACGYLLERGAERALAIDRFDAWSRLAKANGYHGNPMQSLFAILALRHLPDRAMSLVRATLRGSTPVCVEEMTALLAALDQRWCHRELAAALSEPRRATHAYLAAGLRRMTSDIAKRRGAAAPPPPRAPDAIGFTFDEVVHANADDQIADKLGQWRELAAELRAVYPEDWDGSWPVPADGAAGPRR